MGAAGKLLECTEQCLNTFAAALATLPPGQGVCCVFLRGGVFAWTAFWEECLFGGVFSWSVCLVVHVFCFRVWSTLPFPHTLLHTLQYTLLTPHVLTYLVYSPTNPSPLISQTQLHTEYTTLRDRLLHQLLHVATQAYTSTANDAALQAVESLAEAHQGYAQLWEVCQVLQDEGRLHAHMAVVQDQGRVSFAYYVFERYGDDGGGG